MDTKPGLRPKAGAPESVLLRTVSAPGPHSARPRVAFHTLGCKLNFSETSSLRRLVREAGFDAAAFPADPGPADAYVINTCSVTENADRKCRAVVRQALRRSPGAFVVVVGCYAQLKPAEIAEIPGVDLVLGAAEKFRLPEYLGDLAKRATGSYHCGDIAEHTAFTPSWSHGDRTRTFLKVQDGCDYDCSFCTIPRARGRSRSDTVAGAVARARALALRGTREVVLTGINLGDFGLRPETAAGGGPSAEGGPAAEGPGSGGLGPTHHGAPLPRPAARRERRRETFFDLVRALDDIPEPLRFRISSIEPNLLDPEIIDFVAGSRRFTPHFHVPLQSGSDRILGLMRRRYRRALYEDRVARIRAAMPHAAIGVDVIVGFPGEGPAEFAETADFLRELAVDYLHVFPYSERDHTDAVDLPGSVDPGERLRRARILRGISQKKRRALHARHAGEIRPVLFEAAEQDGLLHGFTDNYIKVSAPARPDLPGRVWRVRLGAPDADGTTPAAALEGPDPAFAGTAPIPAGVSAR
jgi:threonylcarbamoyladenosine tRNA methylthiotransferase MtaB